ncbi:two pore domain potassium channel family protein, partial [Streptomyces cavourensis]
MLLRLTRHADQHIASPARTVSPGPCRPPAR